MTDSTDVVTLQAQLANALLERRDALDLVEKAFDAAAGAELDSARRRRESADVAAELGRMREQNARLIGQGIDLGRELGRAAGLLDAAGVPPVSGALTIAPRIETLLEERRDLRGHVVVNLERALRAELALVQLVSARMIIRRRPEA